MTPQTDIKDLLDLSSTSISLESFILSILLALLFSAILERLYVKYGNCVSDRRILGRSFIMITLTTAFIIAVVKSSLALSLGLVGALSIVRFRVAIKEPEELCYLFCAISLGLGLGANQYLVTSITLFVIASYIIIRSKVHSTNDLTSILLSVYIKNFDTKMLSKLLEEVKLESENLFIRRLDFDQQGLDAIFLLHLDQESKLTSLINKLKTEYTDSRIELLSTSES